MATTLIATIEIEAPLLTKSSAPGEAGLDAIMARNAKNEAVLHDRHIKGKLRDAWRELAADLKVPVDDWLGYAGANRQNSSGDFRPRTGLIQVKDFTGPVIGETDPRIRIQIDSERRAAQEHMLQMIESPFDSGDRLVFRGVIECEDGVDVQFAMRAITAGLYWAGTCGGMRTSGFGRIVSVNLKVDGKPRATVLTDSGTDRLWVWLTTSDSVCVTESRAMDNLYVSGQTLPGGVIKGALASTWLRALGKEGLVRADSDSTKPQLSAHFDKIRFSHGRVTRKDRTASLALVPPLSIGRTGTSYRDFALCSDIHADGTEAVTFEPDWKISDRLAMGRRFGSEHMPTELRVRTAIDPTKRRAADSQLFAWQVIVPKEEQGWTSCIDCGAVPEQDRATVRSQLLSLLSRPIRYVGKTKATLNVELLEYKPTQSIDRADVYVLTLQTPALLGNPDSLTEAHSGDVLLKAYAADFATMSNGALKLVRFFAKQYLQGGMYLYKHFLDGGDYPYQPYLLTQPGSVFVMEPAGDRKDKAVECIREWARFGLPAAPWSAERYRRGGLPGDHWSNHPYLRENGFGEIAVNLSCHWEEHLEIPEENGGAR